MMRQRPSELGPDSLRDSDVLLGFGDKGGSHRALSGAPIVADSGPFIDVEESTPIRFVSSAPMVLEGSAGLELEELTPSVLEDATPGAVETSPGLDAGPPDDQLTPSANTFREVERSYIKEERWLELVQLLQERAGASESPAERIRCLVRAAQLFDTTLGNPDGAVVTLLEALREDPGSDEVSAELARLATLHNRWDELLARCTRVAAEITADAKRADLLVTMALWYEQQLEDLPAAEAALEAAMAADPTNGAAVRSLVLLHGRRGDWHRAAAYLTCAAGKAVDPLDGVDYALDAAEIYNDQLHDSEAATVQYMRVLAWSPDHPKAVAALAEAAWGRKDWSSASSLLEGMARSAKNVVEDAAQLWYKAAWSAQMTGYHERARDDYRKAYAALPSHLPTLRAWSQLAADRGWWQDVLTTVPRLLAVAAADMPGEERAGHLMRLGQAHVALRDLAGGTQAFMEALRLAPDLPGARQALAKATAQMEGRGASNARALVEQFRVLLHGPLSIDERFDIVSKIGHLQREELNDLPGALGSYLQAAELKPDDIGVLHELVELHTINRHWSRAVDVLQRLASLTSGREKVVCLVAQASILNCELDSPAEAVAVYERALDEDASDEHIFEHVENILIRRRNWRDLARAYRRMIKRLGVSLGPDRRPWLLRLWRSLADTCRWRLQDLPAAVAAHEVCVSLAPEDPGQREALAESYEAMGEPALASAISAREQLLLLAQDSATAAHQIRALAALFGKHRLYDGLFCCNAALCALTVADARERAFYESNAPRAVPLARTLITEKQWQGYLCLSVGDRLIEQVLAAVAPAVIAARARHASFYGLDPGQQVTLESDGSFVSRLLLYASRLIGVALPPIFVPPGAPGEIDVAVVLEQDRPLPVLTLGRDLVVGRTHQELTFLVTKKLVGLRAAHFLLWPQLVSTSSELRTILGAAIKLAQPGLDLPGADAQVVRKYASYLSKALPADQVDLVQGAVAALLAALPPSRIDVEAWVGHADQVASRAGLLACGDVVAAARELVREARASHARPEPGILDLVRWSVSSSHLELRSRLGVAMVLAENPPAGPAASFTGMARPSGRGTMRKN